MLTDWLDARDLVRLDDPEVAGSAAGQLAATGLLDLPLPGRGRTGERFAALRAIGRADLTLAKLAEPHADALAILADLDPAAPTPTGLVGVWAADPPSHRLEAGLVDGGWRLHGAKPWCSGATTCASALVTAHAPDGYRLFAVDGAAAGVTPEPGSWPAFAMSGTASLTVHFDAVPARPVGGPGDYVQRVGFWHGGTGIAAVWLGGAEGVADALVASVRRRAPDAHTLAHLGAVDVALHAARTVLAAAAGWIDSHGPGGADQGAPAVEDAMRSAMRARAVVERSCVEVLDRVGRALGAAPLALNRAHARRVADLTLFLRQSHAERDLAHLGSLVPAAGAPW